MAKSWFKKAADGDVKRDLFQRFSPRLSLGLREKKGGKRQEDRGEKKMSQKGKSEIRAIFV